MADYFLQSSFKQSFTLSDIDTQLQFSDQFPGLNDTFFPGNNNLENTFPGLFIHEHTTLSAQPVLSNENNEYCKDRKRKAMEIGTTTPAETSSANIFSDQSSFDNGITKTNSGKRGKQVKENVKEREVVHVRAKRGQATDSHSLAERVRRGKINERLRCLQDIVPGCYKTMGMSVMLDEIINYVQSLQSQVEFLSMRLTAASTFFDINDMDAIETIQRANGLEALKIENIESQGLPYAQNGSLDLNFGYYPHNMR